MKIPAMRWLISIAVFLPLEGANAQVYDFTAVTQLLNDHLDLYRGNVLVVMSQDDREIYRYEAGSIGEDTRIPIASATKWLSGTIILKLAELGHFGLDDRVGDYLPVLEEQGKGDITIRQCFAMKSGLVETNEAYVTDALLTLEESVNLIASNTPVVFTPGTQLAYDGAGMQVVGRVAEVVTGKDWRTLASEVLFEPVGMTNCNYNGFALNPAVAGGARCPPAAYLRFLDMIMDNGGTPSGGVLLASSSIQEFFRNQTEELPEYYAPWPPSFLYPNRQRPDYGMGSWIMAQNPTSRVVEEVSSPGAFGTFPWVDRKRHVRGAIFMLGLDGFADTVYNNLRILNAIRSEIDSEGLPPLGPPDILTPSVVGNYLSYGISQGLSDENTDHRPPGPWRASSVGHTYRLRSPYDPEGAP